VTLTASGGTGYLWSTTATTPSISVTTGGTYVVTVTNANGCIKTTSRMVILKPLPDALISPDGPTSICQGETVTLTASGGNAYLWSNMVTTAMISVSSQGTYDVTVTNVFQCTATASTIITVNPLLPVSVVIAPSANPVLQGEQVQFTTSVNNGGALPLYQWKVNGSIVEGAAGDIYSYVPSNNDEVACVLTSNVTCPTGNPAISNTVVMLVNTLPVNTSLTGMVTGGQSECFGAQETITVAGGGSVFTVLPGGTATMIAGYNIIYLPGSSVHQGGYMHGYITLNNEFCVVPSHQVSTGILSAGDGREDQRFKVYPNPAPGNVTVEAINGRNAGRFLVEIYNMQGGLVYKSPEVIEKMHECLIRELPEGCYFIKISDGTHIESRKLIKSRE
jgi:hypothetical protein